MITNPLYHFFVKRGLIKKKNLKLFHNKTRDNENLKSYIIRGDKSIFLEKFLRKYPEQFYPKYISIKKVTVRFKNKNYLLNKKFDDNMRRYNQFKQYLSKKDVLDFGSGEGEFLDVLKTKKIAKSISAFEIRKDCLLKLKRKKINTYKNIKNINKKFDIITMFHVLEHLPNPYKILKNLKKLLKKNGIIILELPSNNDVLLNNNKMKNYKNFILWSEHIVIYSESLLSKLFKILNFKKFEIINFQRYGLQNHLGWQIFKEPGHENKFNGLINNTVDKKYKKFLELSGATDTFICVLNK